MNITRRNALALLAALPATGLLGSAAAFAKDGDTYEMLKLMNPAGLPDKAILGPDNAPVTIIEYASPTCPHCARFSENTFPQIKTKYIDTGKVRFIMRPFIRNVLDAAVFMLAECSDGGYHEILNTFFKTQNQWVMADKPGDEIKKTALQLGFTDKSYQTCLSNQDMYKQLVAERDQATNDFGVEGTPTFFINGKQESGELSFDEMAKFIDPLLNK